MVGFCRNTSDATEFQQIDAQVNRRAPNRGDPKSEIQVLTRGVGGCSRLMSLESDEDPLMQNDTVYIISNNSSILQIPCIGSCTSS